MSTSGPTAPGSAGPERAAFDPVAALAALASGPRAERLLHVHEVPARAASLAEWPDLGRPQRVCRAAPAPGSPPSGPTSGQAADLAHDGSHVVMATGTASGKSLGYLLPVLVGRGGGGRRAVRAGARRRSTCPPPRRWPPTSSPGCRRWPCPACARRPTTATPPPRSAAGSATTPTSCSPTPTWCTTRCCRCTSAGRRSCGRCATSSSTSATPTAASSAPTSRRCCAGCGGSCARYGSYPTFVLASATVRDPGAHASRLIGMPVAPVTEDGSPREAMTFALWEPGLLGEGDGRRSATSEAADLLADLVSQRRADGGLRQVPRRGRGAGDQRPPDPDGGGARAGRCRRGIPRGLSARGAARAGALAALGRDRGAGGDQRAGAGHRHQRARRRAARRLARHAGVVVAAGGAGRAGGHAVAGGATSPPTTRSTPTSCTTPRWSSGSRSRPPSSTPTTRTSSARTSRPPRPSCRCARPTSRCSATRRAGCVDALVARGILRRRPTGWFWARTDRRVRPRVAARGRRGRGHRRAAHRSGAGHHRRGVGAHAGAHRGGARAPGRQLRRDRARPRARARATVVRGDPGWSTFAQSVSAFDIVGRPAQRGLGAGAGVVRDGAGAHPGDVVPAAAAQRRGDRDPPARPARSAP